MTLKNVDAVVGNYYETGVRSFVMGDSILTQAWVDDLRAAAGMPLVVVRLTLPIDEIERRLAASVTAGRAGDLEDASGRQPEDAHSVARGALRRP